MYFVALSNDDSNNLQIIGSFNNVGDAKLFMLTSANINNNDKTNNNIELKISDIDNDKMIIEEILKQNENIQSSSYLTNLITSIFPLPSSWTKMTNSADVVDTEEKNKNKKYNKKKYSLICINDYTINKKKQELILSSLNLNINVNVIPTLHSYYSFDEISHLISLPCDHPITLIFLQTLSIMEKLTHSLERLYEKENENLKSLKSKCLQWLSVSKRPVSNIMIYIILGHIYRLETDFTNQWHYWNLSALEGNSFAIRRIIEILMSTREFTKALEWCEKFNDRNLDIDILKKQIQYKILKQNIQKENAMKWSSFKKVN